MSLPPNAVPSSIPSPRLFVDQLLRHSPGVVFVRDAKGRYLQVSKSYCALFALSERDFLGHTAQEVLGTQIGEQLQGSDQSVLKADAPLEFDVEIESGGKRHAFRTLKFPLHDEQGNAYAVCGIGTDVTSGKRHQEALNSAALVVSAAQGDSLFDELSRFLATALDVDGAFIAICPDSAQTQARTMAFFMDGRFEQNLEYGLSGTVCGTVIGREFRMVPGAIRDLYPQDRMFRHYGIESYAAHPLVDSHGMALGLIAVLSRRPMMDEQLVQSMLRIFAARAESEMERLRAEENLRASEASYRTIFESSEDAIFLHDWGTGMIVDANPKACEIFGLTLEKMRLMQVDTINAGVIPYVPDEVKQRLDQVKAGNPQHFEWYRRTSGGGARWEEIHVKSAIIAGQPRVLSVARDITARKQAEQALRDAALAVSCAHGESVFAHLVTSVSTILRADLVFIAETRDAELTTLSMQAFYVDGQLGPLFDYAIKGSPCETVVGKGYRVYTDSLRSQFSLDDEFVSMGLESYAGFPLMDPQGRSLGIIAMAGRTPITNPALVEATLKIFATRASAEIERRRAEEELRTSEAQLRQAQRMEAIGHLTGGIAHDFNNILTSILGYLTLAFEHQDERMDDPKLAHYLEEAQGSAQRARDLIQQMMTFSRGQRGSPRPMMLSAAVNESLRMLRATLPATVEIATRLQPDVSGVMLDPVHLSQVLLNLCINARDAMNASGRISVTVADMPLEEGVCSSCRQKVTGPHVSISVRDSGPGIAPHVMEHMFEPFYTTKEVGRGTGMGLATVHGIVHEHHGHVLVDSWPDKGARFRVVFPALPSSLNSPSGESNALHMQTPRKRLRGRVLVVDDERAVGAFMRDLLEKWGLDVMVESNPVRAEELFVSHRQNIDLVITDQAMPRMTGVELATRLQRIARDLPVLLYTGYAEGLSESSIRAAGIRGHLHKPIDPESLFTLLQAHLVANPGAQSMDGTNM